MSSSPPQIVVRGQAVLVADPEVADVGVTVRARARDRQVALERCAALQESVTRVLEAAGDAVEEIDTAAVSVSVERRRDGSPGEAVASVTTRLTIGRLDAAGEVVVALGRQDGVDLWGPNWRLRRDSPVFERARLAALEDAVRRARGYARAFGAELAALLSVSDEGLSGSSARFAAPAEAMASFGSDELRLDLAPARQEVHGAVEVRFAMSEPDQEVFRR